MKSSLAYVLAPALGYFIAHLIKYLIGARRRIFSWRQWFRSGGMPSSHTAVVVALSSVILFHEGVSSLFAVAAVLAAITISDAMAARRSIGEQGEALVKLLRSSRFASDPLPKVALGHRPVEVIAGAGLGVIIGFVIALFTT